MPKVLVVDDEQDILELIRHSLAKEGFEVHVAANGAQAIEQARKVKPEIIIMDVMMPVMDGMEACRQLKDNPDTKNIPVIFLTARSEEFAELAGFEAGADDYIAKPVRNRVLLSRVKAILRRGNAIQKGFEVCLNCQTNQAPMMLNWKALMSRMRLKLIS